MQIESFLKAIDNRITCGGKWMWNVFGEYAHLLESEGKDLEFSCTCVFDTRTKQIYELQAHDDRRGKTYRWIDPSYINLYKEECKRKGVDFRNVEIDLDVEEDILQKITAIARNEEYDDRIMVNIDFENDDELLQMLLMAHEEDLTFNAFVGKTINAFVGKTIQTHMDRENE
jgi:hypothetical protein